MLAARAPCSHFPLRLRQASNQLVSNRHRNHCSRAAGVSTRSPASRDVIRCHNRRLNLTTLLGSTVLAMGFGTSAVAGSSTSPTVETVSELRADSLHSPPPVHAVLHACRPEHDHCCRFCKIQIFLIPSRLALRSSSVMMRPLTPHSIPSHDLSHILMMVLLQL